MGLYLLCKASVIMAGPGHSSGVFLLVQERVSAARRWPQQKPGRTAGLCSTYRAGERSGCLVLYYRLVVGVGRLGTPAGAFGQGRLDLLDCFGLGDALHDRDFAREPIERRLVE